MQYGDLTEVQIARFDAAQAYSVRKPSFVIWIEGFGDPTEYVMKIDTEVALGYPLGRGQLNVGTAIITMSNEDGYFYSDGKSNIKKNARIKVWTGFDNLNIPIFTGVIYSVEPSGTTDVVVLNCKDYMGLFQEILIQGSQDPNNTPKLLLENFCEQAGAPGANIAATDETTCVYTEPTFEEQSMLKALEDVCNSIFYVAYFDEYGNLNAVEREYSNLVDFCFKDNNVIDCENLVDTDIVNDITMEYRENFFYRYEDQVSIDTYGRRARSDRTLLLNSTLVSDETTGSIAEELNHDLEAFKFTSTDNAVSIDCLHIKMKKNQAHGYITASIYTNSGGVPGTILSASQLKTSANLSTEFAWEIFYFSTPVEISPSTGYWVVIDPSSVSSGVVYVRVNVTAVFASHAYYSDIWHTEDNKHVLYRIRGSIPAQRVAEDTVRFYKDPHERIRITSPAVPQLQLLDEVMLDIASREVWGRYVIEGRRHIITPYEYTNIDTLRKVY